MPSRRHTVPCNPHLRTLRSEAVAAHADNVSEIQPKKIQLHYQEMLPCYHAHWLLHFAVHPAATGIQLSQLTDRPVRPSDRPSDRPKTASPAHTHTHTHRHTHTHTHTRLWRFNGCSNTGEDHWQKGSMHFFLSGRPAGSEVPVRRLAIKGYRYAYIKIMDEGTTMRKAAVVAAKGAASRA